MEGGWRVASTARAAIALGATIALAFAGAGCGSSGGSQASPGRPVATDEPAVTFAPLVYSHPEEGSFPISATRFVARSSLKWKDEPCLILESLAAGRVAARKEADDVPLLDPRRLGGERPYSRRALGSPGCTAPTGRAYATDQPTRPYDRDHPAGLGDESGFYLDLLSDSYDGDAALGRRGPSGERVLHVPAYFDQRAERIGGEAGLGISYWLLYAHHESTGRNGEALVAHEGDWKRIDVDLLRDSPGRYAPVSLRLHRDGGYRDVPWREVARASAGGAASGGATHPVIFSARESHFPYAHPGRHERAMRVGGRGVVAVDETARCEGCAAWRTWRSLRRVEREPWYGYGGGWGLAFGSSEESGPPGPVPFRR